MDKSVALFEKFSEDKKLSYPNIKNKRRYKSTLMIAPRLADPKKAGGMLVFVENLLHDLKDLGVEYGVVNTNSQIYKNLPHMLLVSLFSFFRQFRKYDHIFLVATKNQLIILGPVVVFFGKMFGKTVSIKKTAGRFHREYEKLDPIRKKLVEYTFKHADIVYFETKLIVDYFKHLNKETYWHPNIRRNPNYTYRPKTYQKRFAFISMIIETKGMDELLEASNKLDDSFTIDVYGKVGEAKYTNEHFEKYNVNFRGPLAPDEVLEKLKEYDVIVLPSHEEGYPGIFMEAFSFGIPVLTTTLQPIMEIVTHQGNGILVPPKDVDSLYQGFLAFNEKNYAVMSKNAYKSFDMFDSLKQTRKIMEQVNTIAEGSNL
ncbi:MAG TPA: glycosyltransferase [Sulfurimonas autotrophica]|nr:glycosyltransferase [Sulfurimonas autotrophica]